MQVSRNRQILTPPPPGFTPPPPCNPANHREVSILAEYYQLRYLVHALFQFNVTVSLCGYTSSVLHTTHTNSL